VALEVAGSNPVIHPNQFNNFTGIARPKDYGPSRWGCTGVAETSELSWWRLPRSAPNWRLPGSHAGSDRSGCLGRGLHWNDLELDQVVSVDGPPTQAIRALRLHDLKAELELEIDPARHVLDGLGAIRPRSRKRR
jgi:hypothetical protein